MFLLAAEFPVGRSSRHNGQAQLSRLQAGQADCQSFQSFPVNMAEEGATPFTSPREALDHHPTALEAQCRLQVSMPMEGSAQLGMKRKQGRPFPHTPPRTHQGAQSQAAMELSTPGSDPEP